MSLIIDIKKKFNNFSLEIQLETREDYLGILGASGSGKSLTLKCIAGIETPDEGKIIFDNKVLFDAQKKINLPPQAREIGYLFQNYALFQKMTVAENILCGEPKTRAQELASILEKYRLQGLEKLYPRQLSGGQQQRLALARMMTKKPKLILLDEPFSAMDSHLKEELQKDLKYYISEQGQKYIFVTHNQEELYSFSQDIAIVEKGKVCSHKSREELFKNPENHLIARLLGYQNIFEIQNIKDLIDEKDGTTAYIAIYAQDFVYEENPQNPQAIPFKILEMREKAFTYHYILENSKLFGAQTISWEINKSQLAKLSIDQIIHLSIAKEKIKLLRK